jgi:hypothetical protein
MTTEAQSIVRMRVRMGSYQVTVEVKNQEADYDPGLASEIKENYKLHPP